MSESRLSVVHRPPSPYPASPKDKESAKCSQTDPYIGRDQFFEIFSRLPSKFIIKSLSSLSKTLSSLLSESTFLETQSINSSRSDGGFFLQPGTNARDKLEFHVIPTDSSSSSLFGIPNESLAFLKQNGRVLDSSQGLVLVHTFVNEFLIFNPVTRSCAPIPVPENIYNFHRFGDSGLLLECHPRNLKTCYEVDFPNDYTVVAPVFVRLEDDPWCFGYRLAVYRNGKWDDDTCDLRVGMGRQIRLHLPVGLFRGPNKGLVVHYLCDSLPSAKRRPVYLEPYVAAYDVVSKKLWKTLKLPEGAWMEDGDHEKLNIFKWRRGETVGLVRKDQRRLTVWVLEDYEGESTWRRVVSETASEMGVPEEEGGVVGCSVVNGRGLVLATKRRVYVYEMEGAHAGRLEVVGEHGCRDAGRVVFTLYANTLRPVCGGETSVVKF